MVQAGLVDKWYRDEVTYFEVKQSSDQGSQEDEGEKTDVGEEQLVVRPLALDHLQVQFIFVSSHSLLSLSSN